MRSRMAGKHLRRMFLRNREGLYDISSSFPEEREGCARRQCAVCRYRPDENFRGTRSTRAMMKEPNLGRGSHRTSSNAQKSDLYRRGTESLGGAILKVQGRLVGGKQRHPEEETQGESSVRLRAGRADTRGSATSRIGESNLRAR